MINRFAIVSIVALALAACGGGGDEGGLSMGPDRPPPTAPPSGPADPSERARDWIFAGSVASRQARTDGIAAVKKILADGHGGAVLPQFSYGYAPFEYDRGTGTLQEEHDDLLAWGYWNHAGFDGAARLFQTTGFRPQGHEGGITAKAAVAILEHGYFGIGHHLEDFRSLADGPRHTRFSTGGFYAVDNSLGRARGRDLRSVDLTGSAYSGSAFAIERHSQAATGHLGTALMLITGANPDGPGGEDYSLTLSINLANGAHFNMTGRAGGPDDFGRPKDNFVAGGGRRAPIEDGGIWEHNATGRFAGPNAEEAFGAFETPDYRGSFGMTRQ